MQTNNKTDFMDCALQLANLGRFTVSPNPMVGCVIVKHGQIVGQGYHKQAGQDHAEIIALKHAGDGAQDAEVYLTLEPCCHYGRTPPCVDALIKAGVKKVYVACLDPNPLVDGRGVAALRQHGIIVEVGLHQVAALKLNEIFFHYIQHHRPLVIAKWAMSLNGKTHYNLPVCEPISGEQAQVHTHNLRQQVDAILVGSVTARLDDPALTVRFSSTQNSDEKHPIRIILTGKHRLPLSLKLLSGKLPGKTIIVTARADDAVYYRQVLSQEKVDLMVAAADHNENILLPELLTRLAQIGIASLLIEGGMELIDSFFAAELIDKIELYLAPCIIARQKKISFTASAVKLPCARSTFNR